MVERTCPRCRQRKPLDAENFRPDRTRPLGFASRCRPCDNVKRKLQRKRAKEKKT